MSTSTTETTADDVRRNLVEFLQQRIKSTVATGVDLFTARMVSSLFALELVVHLESAFEVTIGGPDLKLDNFRTIDAMTALVLRLREAAGG